MTRPAISVDVEHDADIGAARRAATALAAEIGLSADRTSDVALITTELATNIVRHGEHGGVLVAITGNDHASGVEICAWDRGPGMNIAACIPDGVSTRGTRGVGLGAVARIASFWDGYSVPGGGSVIVARVFPVHETTPPRFVTGAVCVPCPGEQVAGDAWDVRRVGDRALVIVCDGLGHGPGAHDASAAVIAAFRATSTTSPATIVEAAHLAARATRGAAATVVRVDLSARTLTICGVGNVGAWIVDGDHSKQLVTQHGTLGQTAPRAREESYPFIPGAQLVMCSDGLKSRIALHALPGLVTRHPSTIAAVLWRDLARGRDDATAVVVREAS